MKISTRFKVIGITVAIPALAALVLGGVSAINKPTEPTIKYSIPQPEDKIEIIEPAPNQTTEEPVPAETVAPSAVIVDEKPPTPTVEDKKEQEEAGLPLEEPEQTEKLYGTDLGSEGCKENQVYRSYMRKYATEEEWQALANTKTNNIMMINGNDGRMHCTSNF